MKNVAKRGALVVKRSFAGLGLFAKVPFRKGDFVIEYKGQLISTDEADKRGGRYLFDVNKRWTVDGSTRKNIARYINHSCRPNCEVDIYKKQLLIYARRNIAVGEELSYDYGKEYVDEFIRPGGCRCQVCNRDV
jgi:uncharacterized protein